jgi:hypothetical protein
LLIFPGWLVGACSGLVLGVASMPAVALVVLIVLFYILGYVIATISIAQCLPECSPPLIAGLCPVSRNSVMLPACRGESFARAFMIGMTAALNAVMLAIIPVFGIVLAAGAFSIFSLAVFPPVARDRRYQALLGWSAWLFPMSWFATIVGALLFVINFPFAVAAGGIRALRVDYRVGAIESSGGLVGIPALNGGFVGGFSLGNFNFLTSPRLQGSFTAQTLSAHESGHTLNTAAFGGVMLWINAVDENIPPFAKYNLAYGELTTESHAQAMPAPPARITFFVSLWGRA